MVKLTWSIVLLTCLGTAVSVTADRQTAPVRPLPPAPLACNNFPKYYNLPVNRFFWLGAHDATSQDRSLTEMLRDGIRLLDLNLCSSSENAIVACSDSSMTLQDIADEILDYARVQEEQVITVNANMPDDVSLSAFEKTWDQACKVHTERVEGIDPFEDGQCPFIYRRDIAWKSLGSLVNYDPEAPQWEGDGELVGIRSKIVLTTNRSGGPRNSVYFSEQFWRSTPKQNTPNLNEQLNTLCKTPGAVGIEGYVDPSSDGGDSSKDEGKAYFTPTIWENAIVSQNGCNIDNAGADVFVNAILVDQYHYHLKYLHELQTRMIPVNFAKWQGQSKIKLAPSKLVSVHHPHERDEL
ncbi:hypothetical protein BDB00DRAFT_795269 [Zychaea mexicana]|uniref:uncharacterized protein n=1 Tax=Zychaea mexicana TaxID=64656 RepID=UPI0022FE8CD7|nr:uncharacterized protein BDB00DRAFT_795269 [Zychaea mexicana]KAI9499718.1 hypothetical protein BDB00DRAFT_795269 [Zychaea mexicana]